MSDQLTLDGTVVPPAAARRQAPLTAAQREILRVARAGEGIRPRDAGIILHAHRTPRCVYCERAETPGERVCPHTSSDGVDALKRLAARGLLERIGRGQYAPPHHPPQEAR